MFLILFASNALDTAFSKWSDVVVQQKERAGIISLGDQRLSGANQERLRKVLEANAPAAAHRDPVVDPQAARIAELEKMLREQEAARRAQDAATAVLVEQFQGLTADLAESNARNEVLLAEKERYQGQLQQIADVMAPLALTMGGEARLLLTSPERHGNGELMVATEEQPEFLVMQVGHLAHRFQMQCDSEAEIARRKGAFAARPALYPVRDVAIDEGAVVLYSPAVAAFAQLEGYSLDLERLLQQAAEQQALLAFVADEAVERATVVEEESIAVEALYAEIRRIHGESIAHGFTAQVRHAGAERDAAVAKAQRALALAEKTRQEKETAVADNRAIVDEKIEAAMARAAAEAELEEARAALADLKRNQTLLSQKKKRFFSSR